MSLREGYYHNKKGELYYRTEHKNDKLISMQYIKIIGYAKSKDSTNWRTRIEFKDLVDELQTIEIPNEIVIDNHYEVTKILAENGFPPVWCNYNVVEYLRKGITDKPEVLIDS
jgi:hypothetical protein